MLVAGLDDSDLGNLGPPPPGYNDKTWAAFVAEHELVETVIRAVWAGQCPLCIVDATAFCSHGRPEQGCLRCGQPWDLHPRTTEGQPALFPRDCPPV